MIATEIPSSARPCRLATLPDGWGQRRVFADRNGEGLVPHPCPACLGLGQDLVALG